jgi:hypothetical protein
MTDFDYIGTGGFLLTCQDDEVLGVTKEQAQQMCLSCRFFETCLNGGMLESTSRIIHKPDWNLTMARHMIQLLTTSRTTLPSLKLYEEFTHQCDAIVLDARLCNFVNYMDTTNTKETRFLELANDKYFCFTLTANVKCEQWLRLLDLGILLNRENTNYVVHLKQLPDQPIEWTSEQIVSRRNLDSRVSSYRVHADRSIHALVTIQQLLADSTTERSRTSSTSSPASSSLHEERYTIYFETAKPLAQDHHDLIDRLAGGQAYTRTCADGADFQTEGYTVQASPDVLRRALEPLRYDEGIVCSLRVDHPSPDTIGRLVNASLQEQIANEYHGKIGLDASLNRYFCRKPLEDILNMLEYLVDFSTTARVQQRFTVYLLSSEDKVF